MTAYYFASRMARLVILLGPVRRAAPPHRPAGYILPQCPLAPPAGPQGLLAPPAGPPAMLLNA
eukprot:7270095-Prymnesium_polylepis.1